MPEVSGALDLYVYLDTDTLEIRFYQFPLLSWQHPWAGPLVKPDNLEYLGYHYLRLELEGDE